MAENETLLTRLYRYKAHHVLMWLLYFIFWVIVYRDNYDSLSELVLVTAIYFVFTAIPFYIIVYSFLPRFLYNRRYLLFFLLFLITLLISSAGLAGVLYIVYQVRNPQVQGNFKWIFSIALVSIGTMIGVLAAVKLVLEKIRAEQETRAKEKDRLSAELQYLKAQVNPHFLFNAINSVYFLIKRNPDHAAETLIRLSDLLRFQLYDCAEDRIPIEQEITYLDNFVSLEKLRKGEKVKVRVKHEGELSGFEIAPFLLIPFFENAFKYVSNFSDTENIIDITLKRHDSTFTADIINTCDNLAKNDVGGIGLRNVSRRLELLYPGKHQLVIHDQDGLYSVHLALSLA